MYDVSVRFTNKDISCSGLHGVTEDKYGQLSPYITDGCTCPCAIVAVDSQFGTYYKSQVNHLGRKLNIPIEWK